jgi:hypothetical protein
MHYTRFLLTIIAACAPMYTFAADAPKNLNELINLFIGLIGKVIALIFVLMVVTFVWGIIRGWIIGGASEEGVGQGKQVLVVSLIVFAIVLSLWGIVGLLQSSFF